MSEKPDQIKIIKPGSQNETWNRNSSGNYYSANKGTTCVDPRKRK
ncbi:MAG: hypothetical protein ABJF04_09315 [Reichenbachiella sp.]